MLVLCYNTYVKLIQRYRSGRLKGCALLPKEVQWESCPCSWAAHLAGPERVADPLSSEALLARRKGGV
jgi:hypothetical protein